MRLVTIAAFARHVNLTRQYIKDEITRGALSAVIVESKQHAGGLTFMRTQLAIDMDADSTRTWIGNPRRGSMAAIRRAAKAKGEAHE